MNSYSDRKADFMRQLPQAQRLNVRSRISNGMLLAFGAMDG
jgi:hypothetical protein